MDVEDYQRARDEVKRMGLDPDRIKHHKPESAKPRPTFGSRTSSHGAVGFVAQSRTAAGAS